MIVRLELLAHRDGARTVLAAPAPGVFRPGVHANAWLGAGDVLGTLEVLGRRLALVVPRAISGAAELDAHPRAVGYGDSLAVLDAGARSARADDETAPLDVTDIARAAAGTLFRAPTSGRYYGRPAPDRPPFVAIGAEVTAGATVCMLEVMKTFHRVTYHGPPGRVRELLVAEGADVNVGEPLLAIDPST